MPSKHPDVALWYRLFFLYIEPVSTLVGAYFAFFQSQYYLDLTHRPTSPNYGVPISTQIVLNQLANLYYCFAINEALVLRITTDLKVWRALLIGLLIADIGHLYSVHALGLQIYWDVKNWNPIDFGNLAFVYVGALTRIAFLSNPGGLPLHFKFGSEKTPTTPRRSTRRIKPTPKAKD